MNQNLNKAEKLVKDLEGVSPENLEGFVHESLKLFHQVIEKLQSKDAKEREEALAMAESLKDSLEEQSHKAMEAVNMGAKELESFTNDPDNFTEEEWEALTSAKQNIASFQEEINKKDHSLSTAPKKASKRKSTWITG